MRTRTRALDLGFIFQDTSYSNSHRGPAKARHLMLYLYIFLFAKILPAMVRASLHFRTVVTHL